MPGPPPRLKVNAHSTLRRLRRPALLSGRGARELQLQLPQAAGRPAASSWSGSSGCRLRTREGWCVHSSPPQEERGALRRLPRPLTCVRPVVRRSAWTEAHLNSLEFVCCEEMRGARQTSSLIAGVADFKPGPGGGGGPEQEGAGPRYPTSPESGGPSLPLSGGRENRQDGAAPDLPPAAQLRHAEQQAAAGEDARCARGLA